MASLSKNLHFVVWLYERNKLALGEVEGLYWRVPEKSQADGLSAPYLFLPNSLKTGGVSALDNNEFELFYKSYYSRVVYFFRGMNVPSEDAKDLAHDTFLKVYRHWEDFRGDTSMSKWVDIVSKSIWCNYLRDKSAGKRDGKVISLDAFSGSGDVADKAPMNPEKNTVRNDQSELLKQGIAQLPHKTRMVVILRVYHGLPFEEIASILKVSIETVKSQSSQGKNKLQKILANHFNNIQI